VDFIPIEQAPLFTKVADQIEKLILDGKLKEGQKLPTEKELCEKLQVSRSSIREAMARLSAKGLIRKERYRGYFIDKYFDKTKFVNDIISLLQDEEKYPQEILHARLILEPKIGSIAAKEATPSEIKELKTALDDLQMVGSNPIKRLPKDIGFHIKIAEITKNRVLIQLYLVIADLIRKDLWPIMKARSWSKENRLKIYTDHHKDIYTAISNKDEAFAEIAITKHIRFIIDEISRIEIKRAKT
jgi:GntR family transcriptional repressor for pyruvate dehydrogenase complex